MTLLELVAKVRRYTRDSEGSLFTESDVKDFCNEGIDRVRKISELKTMTKLKTNNEEVLLLPEEYHYLISVYSASRCFTQDEQNTLAQMFMNEFESKLAELEREIKNGSIIIIGSDGNAIVSTDVVDYVKDVYFKMLSGDVNGV